MQYKLISHVIFLLCPWLYLVTLLLWHRHLVALPDSHGPTSPSNRKSPTLDQGTQSSPDKGQGGRQHHPQSVWNHHRGHPGDQRAVHPHHQGQPNNQRSNQQYQQQRPHSGNQGQGNRGRGGNRGKLSCLIETFLFDEVKWPCLFLQTCWPVCFGRSNRTFRSLNALWSAHVKKKKHFTISKMTLSLLL